MSNFYFTKVKDYSGFGEAKNKYGDYIKGKFIINIFSNATKEIIFDSNAKRSGNLTFKEKNIFYFKGKNQRGRLFTGKLHLFTIGKVIKFSLYSFEVTTGQFKKGEKEYYYFIDNINLGKLRYNPNFQLNGKKYQIIPYNYGKLSKILQKYGGRQTTGIIYCKDTSQYFYKKDKIVFKLLTLLSFFNANYISLFKIEIRQNTTIKEIYYDCKTYPFSNGQGILDFTFVPINKTIETTFQNFEKCCNNIRNFADLIEIYIESLNAVTIETKFALLAILYEGLKSRYVKSGLVDEYKKDNNGQYIKNKGKKVKKDFKNILIEIFNLEKFRYYRRELDSLVKIRNLVIHEATAESINKKITFHNTLKTYYDSLRMFERFMLKIVGYKGQYLQKTHNKGFVWKTYK